MLISTAPPVAAPRPTRSEVENAREWADIIKQRSTLVGLVEPAGLTLGLVSDAGTNLRSLGTIASSALRGDFDTAGQEIGDLVDRATHPTGVAGVIYSSGLFLKAGMDGLVGGLELYEGIRVKDKFLSMMGVADVVSGASHAVLAAGAPIAAMALSATAAAGKVALVVARPGEYSRIQKAKTFFDAAGAVSSSALKSGIAVMPALVANAVLGPTLMLYMNHEGFRTKADELIDKILEKLGRQPEQAS